MSERLPTPAKRSALGTAVIAAVAVAAHLASLAGCSRAQDGRVEAPIDLKIAPLGAAAASTIATSGESSDGSCAVIFTAERIEKSAQGCYLDEQISNGAAVLHYPCSGDGAADVTFGDHRYDGRVTRGEVELTMTTELDWNDGCRWGTKAVISGTLTKDGKPVLGKLAWDYKDHVIQGSSCSGVCGAKAKVRVTMPKPGAPTNGRAPAVPDPDEDNDAD